MAKMSIRSILVFDQYMQTFKWKLLMPYTFCSSVLIFDLPLCSFTQRVSELIQVLDDLTRGRYVRTMVNENSAEKGRWGHGRIIVTLREKALCETGS